MKQTLFLISILITFCFGVSEYADAADEWTEIPTNADGSLKQIPENTKCREIDFSNDEKRTDTNNGKTFYDICIGSYPKFASTSIEEGIAPFYYLKYYFFPEPMPIYNVQNPSTTVDNTVINGLKQQVSMAREDLEEYNYPLDDTNKDLFLHYPYDRHHADTDPGSSLRGPYQIGYNSFYHNTYRSRYFAEEVTFEFFVLEPKVSDTPARNPSDYSDTYDNKEILFTGEIVYDLYDPTTSYNCFREEFLDYKDECRSIEFYFPTSKSYAARVYEQGEVKNQNGGGEHNKNTIWRDRYPYNNPGEHRLVVNVKENTQLRYQKDLGGEFQRIAGSGNPEQGAGEYGRAQSGEAYFLRQDVDTGGNLVQRTERNGKPAFPGTDTIVTSVGTPILKLNNGHWEYNPTLNENYANYCDVDTGVFGSDNTLVREPTSIITDEDLQTNTVCFNNKNKEYHYWKYYWSDTYWYADEPELY